MKTSTLACICPPLLALLLFCGLAAAAVRPELRDLRFSTVAPGTEKVVLHLNGSYSPKVFTMKGETPRLVLDFAGMTHSTGVNPLTVVNGALVQRIRVGVHPGEAPKTRVVLDLATLAGVSFDQRFDPAASTLTIELTGKGKAATPASPAVTGRTAPGPTQKRTATRTMPSTRLAKPPLAANSGKAVAPSVPAADTGKQLGAGAATGAIGAADGAPAAQQKEAAAEPVAAAPARQDKPPQTTATPETPAATNAAATPAAATGQPAVADTAAGKAAPPVAAQGAATTPGDQPDRTAAAQAPQAAADDTTARTAAPQTQAAAGTAAAPAPAAPAGPVLESVTFDGKSPKGEMVLFKLNTFHPPEVHGVEQGIPRVICDFKDTRLADSAQNLIKTDGQHVKVIRLSKTVKPEKVRVVLDLEPNRSYDLQQVFFKEDNLFVIIVNTVQN
ncbi:MAG: AMIN domain-containing protein [Desulfobulbus sp.]|nr:AMIN domain-containing protein [Desulfobulbus sp.]